MIALICPAREATLVQRDHGGIEAGRGFAQLLRVPRIGDRPSQHEGRPGLGGQQVSVGDDAEDLIGRRENRQVADAVTEHREHELGGGLIRRAR